MKAAPAAILGAIKNGEDVSWIRDRAMPYFGPQYDRSVVTEALENAADRGDLQISR